MKGKEHQYSACCEVDCDVCVRSILSFVVFLYPLVCGGDGFNWVILFTFDLFGGLFIVVVEDCETSWFTII